MRIILYFVGAFVSCYMLMPYAIKIGEKFFMDQPNSRKIHKEPKPRSGGLAVLVSGFIFILFSPIEIKFVSPLIVIFIVGLIDDLVNIPAIYKFLSQIIVSILAYIIGIQITSITILGSSLSLGVLALPFTVLWITAIMNAFNIIDGLDGLASSMVLTSSVFLAILCLLFSHNYLLLLLMIVSGSLLGFLPYNLAPSKVFLGDAGSLSLGYIIAISSSLLITSRHDVEFLGVLFIIFVPVLDTTWAIIRRMREGKSVFKADRGHIHHKIMDSINSEKFTLALIVCWSASIGLMGLTISVTGTTIYIAFAIAVAAIISIAFYNIDKINTIVSLNRVTIDDKKEEIPVKQVESKI